MIQTRYFAAILIGATCLILRQAMESDPVTHILVQLPLLVVAGTLLINPTNRLAGAWARGGIAPLLIALFCAAFWMLPRSIDASLQTATMEIAKFVSVPLLVGVPLAIGWPRAHPLLRGFLKAQAISMLGIMAFLYTHAPVRLCNAYLVSDQERLGAGFLAVACGAAIWWTTPLFSQRSPALHSAPEGAQTADATP